MVSYGFQLGEETGHHIVYLPMCSQDFTASAASTWDDSATTAPNVLLSAWSGGF